MIFHRVSQETRGCPCLCRSPGGWWHPGGQESSQCCWGAGGKQSSTGACSKAAGSTPEPCIPRESVYIILHPPGQPLPIPAHAEPRTAALQTHLGTSDFITRANNKEVQMRMIILLVLHAGGQRARNSHSPV